MAKIKIEGKEYPIRVTMWALLTFKREKGIEISQIEDNDIESLLYYTYLCVKNTCLQDKIDFKYDWGSFIELVEGDPSQALMHAKVEEISDGVKKKGLS